MNIEKISEKERYELLTDIADLYYNQGKTQADIADYYETNRFKIAKLLQDARAEQIVEININYSTERNTRLEKELKEVFGLNKALVVKTQHTPYLDSLRQIGKTGADYLRKILSPDSTAGVMWGKTIQNVISQMTEVTNTPITAVQLAGCLRLTIPSAESRELIRSMAAAYFGSYYSLDVPLYVQSPELKQALLMEPCIQDTLQKTEHMDVVITGIGSKLNLPLSNPKFKPYITNRDLEQIEHCCGSIYGYVLNDLGQIADIDLNKKVITAPMDNILKTPHRLAVVYGRYKAEVTCKALKNHLFNEILTDTDTALNLLNLMK